MSAGQVIVSGLTTDELLSLLGGMITEKVNEAVRNIKAEDLQEKFLTISEVQKMFVPAISRKTVDNWTREGLLQKHVIAGKPLYKYSEVVGAVKCIKKYSSTQKDLS